MKLIGLLIAFFILGFYTASGSNEDSKKNKRISEKYHLLEASDVDEILSNDFIGRNEKSNHTWTTDEHFKYLSNGMFKEDSICQQVAEGDWVSTRFVRKIDWAGKKMEFEMMQFKRFENGKISEIWEYGDSEQNNKK